MFLKFNIQDERSAYGGTCFIEIQYCRMPAGTAGEKLVDISSIKNWEDSSLYIHEEKMGEFYSEYRDILRDGLHSNLNEGPPDVWGINYYSAKKTALVIERLSEIKPEGYEILEEWLRNSKNKNGFYILGV